jgi:hypothetical protein
MSENFTKYLSELYSFGFENAYVTTFKVDNYTNFQFILFHYEYGILLVADTYCGSTLNSSIFQYNWKVKKRSLKTYHPALSTGGWRCPSKDCPLTDCIWEGYHDGRYDVQHTIKKLLKYGYFVTPWLPNKYAPYILHYGEVNDPTKSHNELRKLKLSLLPEGVRSAIRVDSYTEL